jgi:dodecin
MDRTYKKIEIVGMSETSFGEATQNAVAKACQSLRHVDRFEVTEMRGLDEKDQVKEFQVTVKIGFRLDELPAGTADG